MESGCLGGLLRCVRLFCAGDCVGGLCMERMQQEGYQGGFTLYFGNFSVEKRSSNLSTRHLYFLPPNRTGIRGGVGFNQKSEIPYITVYPI